jgi:RNA polymerase sigma factor (sigma-70 family)
MNEMSSSIQTECSKRLETLYNKHHNWLGSVAFNITKDKLHTEDLVSELYLYLSEKCNPKIWYKDSFNLQYCRQFLLSRFLNQKKRSNKTIHTETFVGSNWEKEFIEYDYESDIKIDKAYDEVKDELNNLKKKKGWSSAMIYEHYWMSDRTLDEVSKDIGISKSTVFLAVKKTKKHLKNNIQNPFENE